MKRRQQKIKIEQRMIKEEQNMRKKDCIQKNVRRRLKIRYNRNPEVIYLTD